MNLDLFRSLYDGTATADQYLGLAILAALMIGVLVWNVDEQMQSSRKKRP